MPNRFAGAKAKLCWGYKHLDRYKTVLQEFVDSDACRVTEDRDGNAPIWRVDMVEPIPASLALIVGDCVQNYRAALDYVAYELGLISGMSRKERRFIDFPLAPTNTVFKGRRVAKILGTDERAFVKRYQPYRDRPIRQNLLWVLAYLSNTDKHRRLRFMPEFRIANTAFVPVDGRWGFYTQRRFIGPRRQAVFTIPVVNDVGFSSRAVTASYQEMNVPDRIELHVHFHQRTGYIGGKAVFQILRGIGLRVEEIVNAAEAEFG